MAKVWRIVLWLALGLAAAGLVLGGAGWLTGASPERIYDIVSGRAGVAAVELPAWIVSVRSLLGGWLPIG